MNKIRETKILPKVLNFFVFSSLSSSTIIFNVVNTAKVIHGVAIIKKKKKN